MASLFSSRPRRVVSLASDAALLSAARVSKRSRIVSALKAMLLVGALSVPAMAQTTTLTVTTTADTTNGCSASLCSLRDAISAAYGAAGTTNIQFAAGVTGTITLTSTLPGFDGTINLIGPGASLLTIDGGNSSIIGHVFQVNSGSTVSISGVTIAHGNAGTGSGGGIINYDTLTVNNSDFIGNTAVDGAAITSSTGLLTVNGSTFSGNSATTASGLAGAILTYSQLVVNNSTFYGNSSGSIAGGILNYGTEVVVTNSTFAGNTAASGGPAIISYNPGLVVSNSLFADGTTECYGSPNCPATGTAGNVVLADASTLAPLGTYGGFTETMIPLPGSAAICAATPSLATAAGLTTDQRGFARTNTTYTGYNAAGPCVDAGAVQTHYSSVAFVTQPTNASLNADITPAPTVDVLENTNTVAGIPITLTFSGTGTLGGTLTQTTGAGITQTSGVVTGSVATFGDLTVSATGSDDTLATSLTITPAGAAGVTTLSATSNTFNVGGSVSATLSIASEALTQNQPTASFTPVVGSGGTQPFTYSISAALPAGLTFSTTTGTITGSPTVTLAATNYKVTVTDANSSTANATFSLTVNSAVVATQAVASTTLASGTAATAFTPVTGSGGTGTLTYSVSPALPTGLTFSTSTGTITGTPTAVSATTTYTVTVTDANGATKTNTFSLTVNGAVAATQAIASKVLTEGQPSTSFTPVTGAGGSGTLTYSISPALPNGLAINPSTGAISGSPTAVKAATTYTVTVTDSSNDTANNTFSLTVNGPVTATLVIPSEILAVSTPNAIAVIPVTGAGGTGTLTYSVSPALPAGLAFASATGTITGIPTAASPLTTYTVTVTDANGAMASASLTIIVYPMPLSFTFLPTGPSVAQVPLGGSFTYNFSIAPTETIYPGPVTFSVAGLPTGATYTLSTTGFSATAGPQSLSMTVKAPSTLARNEAPGGRSPSPMFFAMLLPMVAGLGFRRRIPRGLMIALFAIAGVLGMSGLSGCGSSANLQYNVVQLIASSGPQNAVVQQVAYVTLTIDGN